MLENKLEKISGAFPCTKPITRPSTATMWPRLGDSAINTPHWQQANLFLNFLLSLVGFFGWS
jgi:hypothetical protein